MNPAGSSVIGPHWWMDLSPPDSTDVINFIKFKTIGSDHEHTLQKRLFSSLRSIVLGSDEINDIGARQWGDRPIY